MIRLGSGVEGRVVAEYLARYDHRRHDEVSYGRCMYQLARKYKMPVQQIKALVAQYKEQQRDISG